MDHRPTILVLDDEVCIRLLLKEVLEGAGYTVVDTDDGHEALERILEQQDIDLVLTNLRMPVMQGEVLLQMLYELPPRLRPRRVVMTGYLGMENAFRHLGVLGVIQKPFTMRELLEFVEQALSSPAEAAAMPAEAGLSGVARLDR